MILHVINSSSTLDISILYYFINSKFYLISDRIKTILVINRLNEHTIEKIKFTLSGVLLSRIVDHQLNEDIVIRNMNSTNILGLLRMLNINQSHNLTEKCMYQNF